MHGTKILDDAGLFELNLVRNALGREADVEPVAPTQRVDVVVDLALLVVDKIDLAAFDDDDGVG
jgi:hypothetical protein